MSPTRIVKVPARRFTRFVNRPQVQAAFGALLICTALVVAYLAKQSYDDSRDTKKAAKAACIRAQQNGPPLLKHFRSFEGTKHEIPARVLAFYDQTIPKTCPK